MFLTLLQHFVLLCLENLLQFFQLHFLFQQLIVPADKDSSYTSFCGMTEKERNFDEIASVKVLNLSD